MISGLGRLSFLGEVFFIFWVRLITNSWHMLLTTGYIKNCHVLVTSIRLPITARQTFPYPITSFWLITNSWHSLMTTGYITKRRRSQSNYEAWGIKLWFLGTNWAIFKILAFCQFMRIKPEVQCNHQIKSNYILKPKAAFLKNIPFSTAIFSSFS